MAIMRIELSNSTVYVFISYIQESRIWWNQTIRHGIFDFNDVFDL